MAIPDYQTLMLPVLKLLGDGQERSFSQLVPTLADDLQLTDEERTRLLPAVASRCSETASTGRRSTC